MTPGIWVQKITTRQPTDDMIEVAIVVDGAGPGRRRRDDPGRQRGVRARAARGRGGPVQGRARRGAETEPVGPGAGETTDGSPPGVAGQLPIPVETERPAPGA